MSFYAAAVSVREEDSVPAVTHEEEAPEEGGASELSADDSPSSGQAEKPQDERALLAIVLDDCGGGMSLARRVKSLDLPITWAIIPNLKYSAETAEMLRDSDIPFLVHLPMQADGDPDGKAGDAETSRYYYVGIGMSEQEVRAAMTPLLDSLEGAYGVNNHRGSKATADWDVMRSVMDVLSERDLFFLDSGTSRRTIAYKAAREKGLRTARNSLFLDNIADRSKIAVQMAYAISMARKKGRMVAICHLRPETVAFLEGVSVESIGDEGVRLVTLPQLIEVEESRDE